MERSEPRDPTADPTDRPADAGDRAAALSSLRPSEEAGGLGHDPFASAGGPDLFAEALDALGPGAVFGPTPRARRTAPNELHPDRPAPASPHRPLSPAPPLQDTELPDDEGWLERLMPPAVRQRVAALAHIVEDGAEYDPFGFSADVARRSFPIFYALYRLYFRVQSEGHEHLPGRGPAVLVGNHAGLLPFDAAMIVTDCILETDPPRLPRSMVDLWAGSLPWVNVYYARAGQVIGTRENFADVLDSGQVALVFPEGVDGVRKTIGERYHLQRFRVGFIEQALRAAAPIVPVAVIGSENQTPILYDVRVLARRLGLPTFPITPTFPWFGPLGLLPYPVSYRIVYGEPLNLHERYGPEDAEDAALVRSLAAQVRQVLQELIDRNR